jgi:hypothetical protein
MSGVDRNFRDMGARLRRLESKLETEVKELIEYYAGEIEIEAIRAAPGGGDRIRTQSGSISQDQISEKRKGNGVPIAQAIGYIITNNGMSGTIYVEQSAGELAAYVEFGTGQSAAAYLADKDPEWKATARKFYINGLGQITAQPFLLPAILRNEPKFIADLKKAMSELRL